jgi:hypothetical protein
MHRVGAVKSTATNYMLSMSDHKIVLRNYEGFVTTYEEPVDYNPEKAAGINWKNDPNRANWCVWIVGWRKYVHQTE